MNACKILRFSYSSNRYTLENDLTLEKMEGKEIDIEELCKRKQLKHSF